MMDTFFRGTYFHCHDTDVASRRRPQLPQPQPHPVSCCCGLSHTEPFRVPGTKAVKRPRSLSCPNPSRSRPDDMRRKAARRSTTCRPLPRLPCESHQLCRFQRSLAAPTGPSCPQQSPDSVTLLVSGSEGKACVTLRHPRIRREARFSFGRATAKKVGAAMLQPQKACPAKCIHVDGVHPGAVKRRTKVSQAVRPPIQRTCRRHAPSPIPPNLPLGSTLYGTGHPLKEVVYGCTSHSASMSIPAVLADTSTVLGFLSTSNDNQLHI